MALLPLRDAVTGTCTIGIPTAICSLLRLSGCLVPEKIFNLSSTLLPRRDVVAGTRSVTKPIAIRSLLSLSGCLASEKKDEGVFMILT